MAAFRRLVCAAICAGLLSGAVAAVAHQLSTVPLILEAEAYEQAARHPATATGAPESKIKRAAATLVADLLTGIGFALLVAAGLALRGGTVTWRDGLLWGLAGFATFTIAPGIGLPPELPGAAAAPLVARQLWWLAAVTSTGCALALLA
ncbi:MAG: CbtA family protein, partial [Stellaceae bacterium]